jgi:hypothetical protein
MAYVTSVSRNGGKAVTTAKQRPARAKLRGLKTLECLDGRTLASKRANQLTRAIENDLGGSDQMTAGQRQLTQHAAVLGALIESDEVQWLAGKAVDLTMLFAAINSQRRILVTLGLERRSRDVTPPSLSDIAEELEREREVEREAAGESG